MHDMLLDTAVSAYKVEAERVVTPVEKYFVSDHHLRTSISAFSAHHQLAK